MEGAKVRARRSFLKIMLRGVPALAAGGILAQTGVAAAEGAKRPDFPGDAAKRREKPLGEADMEAPRP